MIEADAHTKNMGVAIKRGIDAASDLPRGPAPEHVERLDVDERYTRRNAAIDLVARGNGASDLRSMKTGAIHALPTCLHGFSDLKPWMPKIDAGINYRNTDASAVEFRMTLLKKGEFNVARDVTHQCDLSWRVQFVHANIVVFHCLVHLAGKGPATKRNRGVAGQALESSISTQPIHDRTQLVSGTLFEMRPPFPRLWLEAWHRGAGRGGAD